MNSNEGAESTEHRAVRTIRMRAAFLLVLAAFAACSSPPPPLPLPARPLLVRIEHLASVPLSGNVRPEFSPPERAAGAPARTVRLDVWAVRHATGGTPIGQHARLVAREHGQPFVAAPSILAGLRRIAGEDAAESVRVLQAAAPDTAVVVASADVALPSGIGASVRLGEPPTTLPALLFAADEKGSVRVLVAAADRTGEREYAALAAELLADGPPLVLIWPEPREGREAFVLALSVPHAPPTADAIAAAEAAAREAVARSEERSLTVDLGTIALRRRVETFASVVGGRERRPALLGIAEALDARYTADFALAADEEALVDLARALQVEAFEAIADEAARSWLLERTMFLSVMPRMQRGDLVPGLEAFLQRHCGAAGRNGVALQDALARSPGPAEFAVQLRAENLEFLSDPDPFERVSAFDWLLRNGGVPDGFDPLASRDARRDALDAFQQRQAEQLEQERQQRAEQQRDGAGGGAEAKR